MRNSASSTSSCPGYVYLPSSGPKVLQIKSAKPHRSIQQSALSCVSQNKPLLLRSYVHTIATPWPSRKLRHLWSGSLMVKKVFKYPSGCHWAVLRRFNSLVSQFSSLGDPAESLTHRLPLPSILPNQNPEKPRHKKLPCACPAAMLVFSMQMTGFRIGHPVIHCLPPIGR